MPCPLQAEPLKTPTLDGHGILGLPIGEDGAMKDADAALLAEVAPQSVAGVGRARPEAEMGLELVQRRPVVLGREDGGYAEGGGGLLLALGAVAAVYLERLGGGRPEGDGAALAADRGIRGCHVYESTLLSSMMIQVGWWVSESSRRCESGVRVCACMSAHVSEGLVRGPLQLK